jgi:hypothetical protein
MDDRGVSRPVELPDDVLRRAGGFRAVQGQRVTISGATIGAVTLRASSVQAAPGAAASGALGAPQLGAKVYAVLLCKFSDVASTPAAPAMFTGLLANSYPNLDHFYRENSNGQMTLTGSQVYGWFTLPSPRSAYINGASADLGKLAADCTAVAESTVDFSNVFGILTQYNATLSDDPNQQFAWGGGWGLVLDGISRAWPMTWMPIWATDHSRYGIYAHEMGHSLGLPHSSGPYGQVYDSRWDVMSNSYIGWDPGVNAYVPGQTIIYHKNALGWIPLSRLHVVSGPTIQTVTLEQSEFPVPGSNPLMIRIPIPGTNDHYTVESRRLLGYDQFLPGEAVIIHRVNPLVGARVVDPDLNGDPNDAGAMFLTGETFSDGLGIEVQVGARTTNGWSVTVVPGRILTISAGGLGTGSITASGINCSANMGSTSGTCVAAYYGSPQVVLTATPTNGSTFTGWSGACGGTGNCVIQMSQARTVTASFNAAGCTVTLGQATGGTAAITTGSATGSCGRSVTLTATPANGYRFGSWSSGSPQNPLTFAVNENIFIQPVFVPQCTLSLGVTPSGGGTATLTAGSNSGDCGRAVTALATPAAQHAFVQWSDGNTNASRPVTVTQTNQTLTATFMALCTLTLDVVPSGAGTATIASGAATGQCGRPVSVTATPASRQAFVQWSDGNTSASRQVVVNQPDQVLTASFVSTWIISAVSSPVEGGTVTGHGTYPAGASVTLTATPADGWLFVNWTEGTTPIAATLALQLAATADRSLTANFSRCTLVLSVSHVDRGGATISAGEALGACGRTVTIAAVPNAQYRFTQWSDGNTSASRTVVVDQIIQGLAATFDFQLQPVLDALVACILSQTCASAMTPAQLEYADGIGNGNGRLDIGDLLALMDNGGVLLRPGRLLASPEARSLNVPIRRRQP